MPRIFYPFIIRKNSVAAAKRRGICGSDACIYALQDEVIGQWLIKRNVDSKDKPDFAFDQNYTIKPGAKIRVSVIVTLSALHR